MNSNNNADDTRVSDMSMFDYNVPTIAVLNQKGGVGKTTTASIIAEYASIVLEKRVLVIDLDMQCNSSDYWVGMDAAPNAIGGQLPPVHPDHDGDPSIEERSSIADTFYGKGVLPYETYINPENGFKGLVEVLLGHPERLERINSEFDNKSGHIETEVINRLGTIIHSEGVSSEYDLIVLDTGPSRNPVFRSALRCATHVLIPFEPEEKSLQGINAMLQAISSENFSRRAADQINILGLLANKVRSNVKIHSETLEMLKEELPELLCPVHLPLASAFPERDIKGISPKSIFQIADSHKAKIMSTAVAEHILAKIFPESVSRETPAAN